MERVIIFFNYCSPYELSLPKPLYNNHNSLDKWHVHQGQVFNFRLDRFATKLDWWLSDFATMFFCEWFFYLLLLYQHFLQCAWLSQQSVKRWIPICIFEPEIWIFIMRIRITNWVFAWLGQRFGLDCAQNSASVNIFYH
jgi:hypothetical protein